MAEPSWKGEEGTLEPPSSSLSPLLPPALVLLCPRQIKEEDLRNNKKGREGHFTTWGIDHRKSYKCSHSSSWILEEPYAEVYKDRDELPKEE